jgi:opacity protein-like surface antigen
VRQRRVRIGQFRTPRSADSRRKAASAEGSASASVGERRRALDGVGPCGRGSGYRTQGLGLSPEWVASRLSIGARVITFWLKDTRRSGENGYDNANLEGNFLGSLWGLDAQQHYFPNSFLEYRVVSSFGVGFAYNQARAKTLDWANDQRSITAGDGDVQIRGLQVYVFGRYRNRTRVTPYANLGVSRYWSRFFESPGWSAPGRHFEVDDTSGWFAAVGCSVALWKHLEVDAIYSYSQIGDVTARAYLRPNRYRRGAFPMRSDVLGIGVVYAF